MTYIIAEIGINHNGDIGKAGEMIVKAAKAGVDCVKFQKRTPEICVPEEQKNVMRDTPWGRMTYFDYKKKIEFGKKEYDQIDQFCKELGVKWTASVWDVPSLDFIKQYDVPFVKIPSACITDIELLEAVQKSEIPTVISTGMSTLDEVREAALILTNIFGAMICNSTYPAPMNELDVSSMKLLKYLFPVQTKIGYSGHEEGLLPTIVAVSAGAEIIERHVTLDKNMWGTDQKASLDMQELKQLVYNIRTVETILGNTEIKVYPGEEEVKKKLRK